MKKVRWFLARLAVAALAVALALVARDYWRDHLAPLALPKIDRHPLPGAVKLRPLAFVPAALPAVRDRPYQVDLRRRDLSALDLRRDLPNVLLGSFDTHTRWPAADRMPPGFDPRRILELGRVPGPGGRQLHARGITGRGVGVAIIDQVLLTSHEEYADRLRLYEEAGEVMWPANRTQMHGAAVASLAVGRTVGVAPGADLYFIATWDGAGPLSRLWRLLRGGASDELPYDFSVLARAVRRVLEINRQLPEDRKIRVVAMAIGWLPRHRGYAEISAAVEEARAQGLLVVCSSIEAVHGFRFQGLGRDPRADPEDFASYGPGYFWEKRSGRDPAYLRDCLLVPMDSRTHAGYSEPGEYIFDRQGGWSWSIPYLAGAYALAVQVKPSITPDQFWALALRTGRTVNVEHEGKVMALGPILDLPALIAALERGDGG